MNSDKSKAIYYEGLPTTAVGFDFVLQPWCNYILTGIVFQSRPGALSHLDMTIWEYAGAVCITFTVPCYFPCHCC